MSVSQFMKTISRLIIKLSQQVKSQQSRSILSSEESLDQVKSSYNIGPRHKTYGSV